MAWRYSYIIAATLTGLPSAIWSADACETSYETLTNKHDQIISANEQGSAQYTDALHGLEDELFTAYRPCRDNVKLLTLMGEVQISLGNPQLAHRYALKAMSLDGQYWQTLHLLGTSLCMQEQYAEGLKYLRQAASLAPVKPGLLFNLCSAYFAAQRHEESIQSCTELLQRKDHQLHGPAFYLRGSAYQAQNRQKLTEQDFEYARLLGYAPAK